MMIYDLIIIGAGPAGITASVYAARKKMNFLVVTKDIGGQTAWTNEIENYTGFQLITGAELTSKFQEHIRKYNIPLKNEEVIELKKEAGIIKVVTTKASYESKTAVVASGKMSRELGVPGEKEFKGRGLTYCATCDGPLFAGKRVAVIGGGNSALDAAIQLERIARSVYLIDIAPQLSGDAIMQDKLKSSGKVLIMHNCRVAEIFGDKSVKGIRVKEGLGEKAIELDGVFVEIGLTPNSYFAKELVKNQKQEIIINCNCETNIPGIFAAGDVTDVSDKQIIIAAGDGAKAVLSAFRYIIRNKP